MPKNIEMNKARKEKNDEFYTSYEDIELEVPRYKEQFKDKVVLCNCDDPEWSNFWKFFHNNFSELQLKKLISTHYVKSGSSYAMIYDGVKDEKIPLVKNNQIDDGEPVNLFDVCILECDGDFRSKECIEYLKEADIVVTNPPFSLFRSFILTLVKYNKKFLVLGNMNAAPDKEIFPFFRDNKIWYGETIHSGDREFRVPDDYLLNAFGCREDEEGNKFIRVKGVRWFTNLDSKKRYEDLVLCKKYNAEEYPKYDEYDAINVDKTKDIPCDYYGYMGVPITYLDKYDPEQFELIDHVHPTINGKATFERIIIRRKYDNEGNKIN